MLLFALGRRIGQMSQVPVKCNLHTGAWTTARHARLTRRHGGNPNAAYAVGDVRTAMRARYLPPCRISHT